MIESLKILENSQILFINKVDLEGNYTYLSPYFSDFFDYKPEKYLGTPAITTVIEADHEKCKETILKCLSEPDKGHTVTLRKPLGTKEIIHTQWEIKYVTDLKEFVSIGYDISKKIKSEESLNLLNQEIEIEKSRYQTLLGHQNELLTQTAKIAKLGGWELDAKTMKTLWTSEVFKIHDLEEENSADIEKAIMFYHEDDREIISKAVYDALTFGKSYDLELRLISAKKVEKWVRTSATPIYVNGEITALQGIIQDITEKKLNEEIITRQNALLKEVHFAQSHLIRLPIANIIGLINLLDLTNDDVERFEIYRKIKLSTQQLDLVIKDVASRDLNI